MSSRPHVACSLALHADEARESTRHSRHSSPRRRLHPADDDHPPHMRVDIAVVGKDAGLVEGVAVGLPRIKDVGFKDLCI